MLIALIVAGSLADPAAAAEVRFDATTVDGKVGIGYGVAAADVDGDRKTDIVLMDKDVLAWYRNPGSLKGAWEKREVARKLTALDHVCLAARDLDGDGKAELAAGAGWNPSDTVGSGSLHVLLPPAGGAGSWEPVALPHQPTVHRIRWVRGPGKEWSLVSAPLHGRGNKDGQGEGVKVQAYRRPADPKAAWPTELLDDSLHVIHNLEVVDWDSDPEEEVLLASREGLFHLDRSGGGWRRTQLGGNAPGETGFAGASEVRAGKLPGGRRFLASIEPFHGNKVAAYVAPPEGELKGPWKRREIDDTINGGHALACGDLLGLGSEQIAAGWRLKDRRGKVGIRIYLPLDGEGARWEATVVDDGGMACEDLVLHDLDGDGKLEIIAAGRDTHNLVVYSRR